LTVEQLRKWEALGYGMFISFGLSTFLENEYPDGKVPASRYAPERLMLTSGSASLATRDEVCRADDQTRGRPLLVAQQGHGLHRGSQRQHDRRRRALRQGVRETRRQGQRVLLRVGQPQPVRQPDAIGPDSAVIIEKPNFNYLVDGLPAYGKKGKTYRYAFTTSLYQDFVTGQISELLTQYGPIVEVWLDIRIARSRIPHLLVPPRRGAAARTLFLTNSGMNSGESVRVDYAWPFDALAIEINLPPEAGHTKWRIIEGKEYYLPGECVQPIATGGSIPCAQAQIRRRVGRQLQCLQDARHELSAQHPTGRSGRIPTTVSRR